MGSGAWPLAIITKPSNRKSQARSHLQESALRSFGMSAACQLEIGGSSNPVRVLALRARCELTRDQANRAIRTSQLSALRRFHTWPINVVVFHGPRARPGFEVGFPLRCVQRLSRPYIATQRCRWRDNWYTRGTSIPVLSY
jgi:hypothetical protein